jgi:osmotically-inducible protein OsmY
MKRFGVRLLAIQILLLGSFGLLWAQQDTGAGQNPPADNTKMNQRDRDPNQPTADQQKENPADRQMAQQIRRALVKDKSLSTDARNIKVIVQNGAVTLKGPVRSEDEKQAIEAKAAQVAGGADKVTDQIEVAPK